MGSENWPIFRLFFQPEFSFQYLPKLSRIDQASAPDGIGENQKILFRFVRSILVLVYGEVFTVFELCAWPYEFFSFKKLPPFWFKILKNYCLHYQDSVMLPIQLSIVEGSGGQDKRKQCIIQNHLCFSLTTFSYIWIQIPYRMKF